MWGIAKCWPTLLNLNSLIMLTYKTKSNAQRWSWQLLLKELSSNDWQNLPSKCVHALLSHRVGKCKSSCVYRAKKKIKSMQSEMIFVYSTTAWGEERHRRMFLKYWQTRIFVLQKQIPNNLSSHHTVPTANRTKIRIKLRCFLLGLEALSISDPNTIPIIIINFLKIVGQTTPPGHD